MSRLTDLLKHARKLDAQLGADLEAEFRALSKRRTFGLVFEQHQPEAVELPARPIRRGDKVRILPPRGETRRADRRLWRVMGFDGHGRERMARLRLADNASSETPETQTASVRDLVPVAEFRDTIYPGLVETGRVERGGDKPYHTVINAENFHALELLTYTHRHRVDVIYIDPPYNSGARDWKYNNDYVEADDDYRHSKWLAMMERRLKIARELLNPDDSVLIVTIDEKEYLRLGLLLEQAFPEARMQMISSVINPKGVPRDGFSRVDEYLLILQFGDSRVVGEAQQNSAGTEVRWRGLARSGANAVRSESPGAFYPIFFTGDGQLHSIGDALPTDKGPETIQLPPGLTAVWPPSRPDGGEGRWSVVPETLRALHARGALRLGRIDVSRGAFPMSYLTSAQLRQIDEGKLILKGRHPDGSLKAHFSGPCPLEWWKLRHRHEPQDG